MAYTTSSTFTEKIRRAARRCLTEDTTIRLLFRWCSDEIVDRDTKNMKLGVHTRVWSDEDLKSVIIKLMPSGRHDVTVSSFAQNIVFKLAAIAGHTPQSLVPLASTYFTNNCRGKEGDAAFKCDTQGSGARPNLVKMGKARSYGFLWFVEGFKKYYFGR
jgi:hypothetical protein